jgi:glycosyltransferase involved in cell wall biosynthesis
MIFLVLPYNTYTGWGVCSINLAKELAQKTKIKYVSNDLNERHEFNANFNAIAHSYFVKSKFRDLDYLKTQKDYPVIQAVEHDLTPFMGYVSGSKRIAITFSDRNIPDDLIKKAKENYDLIVAGSQWCKNLLADKGLDAIVIHQGIDPCLFNKSRSEKKYFHDDFLIFSGGKFEDRKGQDITIKAYKVIQDRYPDVKLVCSWFNAYASTTGLSILEKSGIDMSRVIFIPFLTNNNMPNIYQNTDIGVFPSRCEAGTNLVMMEYMACGKPAIASVGTGQSDLITEKNGFSLNSTGQCLLKDESGKTLSIWENPDPEHLIERLDWAYNNRGELPKYGQEAAKTMSKKTWKHMADSVLKLI